MTGKSGNGPCFEGARKPRAFDTDLMGDLLRIVDRGKDTATLPMGQGA
jgi:hypothetical protein